MRRGFALLAILAAGPALADGHYHEQAVDALGAAQTFNGYSLPDAEDTLGTALPTELPQSDLTGAELESAGQAATGAETTPAETYGTVATQITSWTHDNIDEALLGQADAAVSNPDALTPNTTFTSSGGECTVTDFAEAPTFTRVCDHIRQAGTATLTETADITVIRTEDYLCKESDTLATCGQLLAEPQCGEISRVCSIYDPLDVGCLEETIIYRCVSDGSFSFPNPQVDDTTWSDPIITWTTTTSANYTAASCIPQSTICLDGPSVEDVNGVLVPMECLQYETTFECGFGDYTSYCTPFETDPSCEEIARDCYDIDPDGVCNSYELTYECGDGTGTDFSSACEAVNVCVEDYCQSVPVEADQNMPLALASVEMLNELAGDFDGVATSVEDLEYFQTEELACRKSILGFLNCCQDSGWGNGTFAQCNEEELTLIAAQDAGTTVYLGTFCSSKALFFCLERSRAYCVFNSQIGREVSEQAQLQLYGSFECRPLTHAELETTDWAAIDLSGAYGEVLGSVQDLDAEAMISLIQGNVSLLEPEVTHVYD